MLQLDAQIEIEAPIAQVFAFAANPMNDHLWRTEVRNMKSNGPFRVGTVYTETASIGAFSSYVTPTRVEALHAPTRLRVETPSSHQRRLISERIFRRLSANQTHMTYTVLADIMMIRDIWPTPVLPDIAKAIYEARMHAYLLRLKKLLEARS